jgi:phosphoadenosine phosphosulfate reductase
MAAPIIQHADILRRAREQFGIDSILVGVSGGKDATACLDLCCKHFSRVEGFFLYTVPDLEFQQRYLGYLSRHFNIPIHQLPSPTLSAWLREGGYRLPSRRAPKTRRIKQIDVENHLRLKTGIEWIAKGEKCIDSIERNAMIRKVQGIDPKRRHIWPLASWSHASVYNYLKQNRLPLPPDYNMPTSAKRQARSFGTLGPAELEFVKQRYPADYRKIVAMFPLLPANMIGESSGQKESSGQS